MFEFHLKEHDPADRVLRVLIVTESFLPQVNGVTNSVCRVLEQLQALGHTADVIAPTGPDFYAGATIHRVRGVDLPGYDGFSLGLASWRQMRNIIKQLAPDVLHVASPVILGYAAIRAANSLQIPVVSIYQTDMVGLAYQYRMRGAATLVQHRMRRMHMQSDLNLVPSMASFDQLEDLGIPRLRFWPRGIDTTRFTPDNRDEALHSQLRRKSGHPEPAGGEVLVGYVGRLAKEKDLHHLLHLQDIPGIRLVMIGDGPEQEDLQRLLPDALFVGAKYDDELTTLIATLDIFIHPGAKETFCQAVQEGLASGVPAVGPAAGGLKDRICHGVNGLHYDHQDVAGMRAAVARLAGDATLRHRMGTVAREAIMDRSWGKVTEQLISHYRDAIAASNPTIHTFAPSAARMGGSHYAGV